MPIATLTETQTYQVAGIKFARDKPVSITDDLAEYLRATGFFSVRGDDEPEAPARRKGVSIIRRGQAAAAATPDDDGEEVVVGM